MKKRGHNTIKNALGIYILLRENPGKYTRRQIGEKFGIHTDTVTYLFNQMREMGIDLNNDGEPFYTYSIGQKLCPECRIIKTTGSFFPKDHCCKSCRLERLSKAEKYPPYRPKMNYEEAKKWAAENLIPHGVNSNGKFVAWLRGEFPAAPPRPENFFWPPGSPEFKGWADFFGRSHKTRALGLRRLEWPAYSEFKNIVRAAGLKRSIDFAAFRAANKQLKLPSNPHTAYAGEWEGWKKVLKE